MGLDHLGISPQSPTVEPVAVSRPGQGAKARLPVLFGKARLEPVSQLLPVQPFPIIDRDDVKCHALGAASSGEMSFHFGVD